MRWKSASPGIVSADVEHGQVPNLGSVPGPFLSPGIHLDPPCGMNLQGPSHVSGTRGFNSATCTAIRQIPRERP